MKTSNGVQVTLTPATAYILGNILSEWVNKHTPVDDYLKRRYSHFSEEFLEFKRAAITERVTRMSAVIEQLKDKA